MTEPQYSLGDFYEVCPVCGNQTVATSIRIKDGLVVRACYARIANKEWNGGCSFHDSRPMESEERKSARKRIKGK